MSKSSKKREEVQESKNVSYPCFVCGRITVDPEGCALHKVKQEEE